jgi:hypothetical protein
VRDAARAGLEARLVELAGTVRALQAGLARVEREVAALGQGLVTAEVQVRALERARTCMMTVLKQHLVRAAALQAQVDALAAAGAAVARAVDAVQRREASSVLEGDDED